MTPSISIAVSTRNRRESLRECIKSLNRYTPVNVPIFIIDDCSDTPNYPEDYADYRFEERAGISRVKNKSLELCYATGSDFIFALDDDVRVLCKDWYLPYVNSGQHHLSATFYQEARKNDRVFSNGIELKRHRLSNGYCMMFSRECIDRVGGFDERFSNKFEHTELTRRIHNAGLTPLGLHLDVANSDQLIYCLDKDNAIQRSFTTKEMNQSLKDGYELFRAKEKSTEFIPFIT